MEAAPEAAAPAPPPDDAEKVDEDPEKKAFMADLFGFMRERGTPITKVPQLGHREIDLYTLYKQVTARGGIQKVIENKLWKEVAEYFSFPSTCTNASFILRINYIGYLYYYEQVKFWGVTEPPPPPASLGRIPNRKDFPLPPLPARSPAGSRRTREERAQSDDEGDDSGDEAPAPKTRAAAQAAAVSAPQAATPKIPAQPLSMPVYQPAPNIPLGAPVNRPRTGLEALPYALQSGPDFLREWATQILLNLSAHSDARLTHVTGLLTALAGRLRAELELLKREDLASQGFSVGYASRQAAQRLSTVLRNIALSPQADLDMAAHAQCVQTLLQTAECADDVVRENVVEALAALAPHLAAAEAAAALPHLLRALREGLDAETYLHAILQLSISPKVDALFLLADAWRGELLSALTEHLYSSDPALVLLAIQVLYNLSVSGGTTHVAQHLAIVKQLVRFVAGEVRGQSHHEEIARKSALLLFSFSKTPGVWHRELRRHEEDLVAGAALLGATPTGAILLNLVNNLAGN